MRPLRHRLALYRGCEQQHPRNKVRRVFYSSGPEQFRAKVCTSKKPPCNVFHTTHSRRLSSTILLRRVGEGCGVTANAAQAADLEQLEVAPIVLPTIVCVELIRRAHRLTPIVDALWHLGLVRHGMRAREERAFIHSGAKVAHPPLLLKIIPTSGKRSRCVNTQHLVEPLRHSGRLGGEGMRTSIAQGTRRAATRWAMGRNKVFPDLLQGPHVLFPRVPGPLMSKTNRRVAGNRHIPRRI